MATVTGAMKVTAFVTTLREKSKNTYAEIQKY